jgi:hypothetical protein
MDVAEPNFGTAFTVPPVVVTGELVVGFAEPDVPAAITTLAGELAPDTPVEATAWPEIEVGALKNAEAGSPCSVSVSAALRA